MQYWDWFKYEFWRVVLVQQELAKEIPTFIDYPPMQAGASFNLDALKADLQTKRAQAQAVSGGR
jgi:arylsulfatase